jgi:hypothetical protein
MSRSPRWTLVVLRGWADIDGIRVRVLRTDNTGADAEIVVASAEEAGHVVIAWLSDLAADAEQ